MKRGDRARPASAAGTARRPMYDIAAGADSASDTTRWAILVPHN
jgi:hypothetical protein